MPAFLPKVRAASSCSASCRSLRASASAGFSGGGGAVASAGFPGKLLAGKPLEVENTCDPLRGGACGARTSCHAGDADTPWHEINPDQH